MSGDDFFGGSITPNPLPTPGPTSGPTPTPGPAPTRGSFEGPHNGAYGDFRPPMAPTQTNKTGANPLVIIAIVGLVAILGGFWYYRTYMSGPSIEIPQDSLAGIDHMDNDMGLSKQIEDAWHNATTNLDINSDMEVGVYQESQTVLIVAATEWGTADASKQDAFFSGVTNGMGSLPSTAQFQPVDPGAKGGQMKCLANAGNSGVGLCIWIDDGTIGMVALGGSGMDLADTARTVRESVEH